MVVRNPNHPVSAEYNAESMPKKSAGLLLYRTRDSALEVFLVHPGGPLWARKDSGAWTIPKGEIDSGEDPLAAAQREFAEETGFTVDGQFLPLKPQTMKSGKVVQAWAIEGDADPNLLRSNTFMLEWPPRSGKRIEVPEADRGEWFSVEAAVEKVNPAQAGFIRELAQILGL
jgi:predicted NUDIX family NTP pyrophosphohydrolase